MKFVFRFTVSIIFLVFGSISASTPTLINYQAVLTNSSGVLLPDDTYSLTFTIYDSPSGGESKWTETRNVTTTNGQFFVFLGTLTPIEDSVFKEPPRYLGIQVSGDPEVTPRALLVTSPWSFRTSTIDGTRGGSLYGNIVITPSNFDSLGNAITVTDGAGQTVMTVSVKNNNVASVDFYDPVDSRMGPNVITPFQLRLDKDGITFFGTDSTDTTFHVASDGNVQSTGEQSFKEAISIGGDGASGALYILGIVGDTIIILDTTGLRFNDNTHQSTAAINTGVAQEVEGVSSTTLTVAGGKTTLLGQTISCPTDGYVMVTGTCQPTYSHVNGTTTSAHFGVSEDSLSWDSDQDHSWSLSGAAPTGQYANTISVTKIFDVKSGVQSFFLMGEKFSGTNDPAVWDKTLSLVFIPKRYGVVAQSVGDNNNNENQSLSGGLRVEKSGVTADNSLSLKLLQQRIDELESRLNALLKTLSESR